MTKNTAKIKNGIRALTDSPIVIMSGTVVAGSVDKSALTASILPHDDSPIIEGVRLNAVTDNDKGWILIPKDGSNVIIGSIDGPGEWALLRASELKEVAITIGNVKYEMDSTHVAIENGSIKFNIGTGTFKMNTAGESLFQLLSDLLTGLTLLTVGTSTGPSTVPINAATFSALQTRLNSLLSA